MKYYQLLHTTALLLGTSQLSALDLIYRKNNEISKANILTTTDNSVTYKYIDTTYSTQLHISHDLINSKLYINGKKEKFQEKVLLIGTKSVHL